MKMCGCGNSLAKKRFLAGMKSVKIKPLSHLQNVVALKAMRWHAQHAVVHLPSVGKDSACNGIFFDAFSMHYLS